MTIVFLSSPRSLCGIGAALRISFVLSLIVAIISCGREPRQGSRDTRTTSAPQGSHATAIGGRIRTLTTLDVESVQLGAGRTDVTLVRRAGSANPDSEHVALAGLADGLWQDARLGVQSETLAITIVRPIQPGAVERSTYYYYRSRSAGRSVP